MAEKNDANFSAKTLESRAKVADGWALIAAMGPRVSVSGKIMRSRLDYKPEEIAELEAQNLKFDDDSVNISLNQPLLDMEKINRARRGSCEVDIAKIELRKAKEELVVRVVDSYFSLLAAQNGLNLEQSKLTILENQQQTAMASHELGLGSQSDLFDIQARYATTSIPIH
jgi:outer membrane protein